MDLRKSVLKRTQNVQSDSSFGNISNISVYESAAEDTDNSIYYSFVDESASKSIDAALLDVSNETDNTSNGSHSSDIDKENTIIERETGIRIIIQGPTPRNSFSLSPTMRIGVSPKRGSNVTPKVSDTGSASPKSEKSLSDAFKTDNKGVEEVVPNQVGESVAENNKTEEVAIAQETVKPDSLGHPPILTMEDAMIVDRETISPVPEVEIIVEDVNSGKINPFTSPDSVVLEEAAPAPEKKSPVAKRSTRRSSIALQIKPRFYSPVLRKSLDRKTKAANKLASNTRRTVYVAPTKSVPPKLTGKTPTRIPKPATKATFKPRALTCPVTGCTNEFPTSKALIDHQKTHKPATAPQPAFQCRWCDKKFQLDTALFNHQTEKCTKIPVAEKRKVLEQQEKKEKIRRRTTIFAAPMVIKKKSPREQKANDTIDKLGSAKKSGASNKSTNKSRVSVTPKKSLKCHICKEIISDAIGLANHILGHKFDKLKQGEGKETA